MTLSEHGVLSEPRFGVWTGQQIRNIWNILSFSSIRATAGEMGRKDEKSMKRALKTTKLKSLQQRCSSRVLRVLAFLPNFSYPHFQGVIGKRKICDLLHYSAAESACWCTWNHTVHLRVQYRLARRYWLCLTMIRCPSCMHGRTQRGSAQLIHKLADALLSLWLCTETNIDIFGSLQPNPFDCFEGVLLFVCYTLTIGGEHPNFLSSICDPHNRCYCTDTGYWLIHFLPASERNFYAKFPSYCRHHHCFCELRARYFKSYYRYVNRADEMVRCPIQNSSYLRSLQIVWACAVFAKAALSKRRNNFINGNRQVRSVVQRICLDFWSSKG